MLPVKVIKILLTFIFILIVGCMSIEMDRYFDEVEVVNSFVRMAAEEALMQQQDLFAEWNSTGSASAAVSDLQRYNLISAEAAEKIQSIIREDLTYASETESQKWLCPGSIVRYADEIVVQADLYGLEQYNVLEQGETRWDLATNQAVHDWTPEENESEIFDDMYWLSTTAAKEDANYNPLQMGMTYAHEGLLEILFEENFRRLIEDNYGLGAENTIRNPKVGMLRYLDCDVEVHMNNSMGKMVYAKVVKMTEGEEGAAIYKELFGIGENNEEGGELIEEEAIEEYDAWDQFAVVYDITFTAETLHTMKTFVGQEGGIQSIMFGITDTSGEDGTTDRWTEIAGQRYAAIGMPVARLEKSYSILH